MPEPAQTIRNLYAALDAGDGEAMTACYTADATFEDPAFGFLEGPEVGAMWRMLTSRGSGVRVELRAHEADAATGTANWIATYAFGPQERRVVNDVASSYRFAPDGRIHEQLDRFDLARWGAQAMGPVPGLLGRTPLLGLMVRRKARAQLDAFMTAAA